MLALISCKAAIRAWSLGIVRTMANVYTVWPKSTQVIMYFSVLTVSMSNGLLFRAACQPQNCQSSTVSGEPCRSAEPVPVTACRAPRDPTA